MSERTSDALETFSARAHTYKSESSWVSDSRLIDPMLEGLSPGGSIADVCSGTGTVGHRASGRGFKVVALDLSSEMLEQSPIRTRIVSSGAVLPLRDRAVDRVICRQGLHYLPVESALDEFNRVSAGPICIGTITMLSSSDYSFWMEYFSLASPARLTVFGPGEIASSGEAVGLVVKSVSVIQDRGSLLGPIRHLSTRDIDTIRRAFLRPSISERYGVRRDEDDLTYVQRWEFVQFVSPDQQGAVSG